MFGQRRRALIVAKQLLIMRPIQPFPLPFNLSCAGVDRHPLQPDAVTGSGGYVQDARAQDHKPQHEPHLHAGQEYVIQSRYQALHWTDQPTECVWLDQ